MKQSYRLELTTQGPLYPPSEVMDEDGNFVVIGAINRLSSDGHTITRWGRAIVSCDSPLPPFGDRAPYRILEEFDSDTPAHIADKVLCTLPLPLPCSNYPMLFAPDQFPDANSEQRPSYPFHKVPVPDIRAQDGRSLKTPVRLRDWMTARGQLEVSLSPTGKDAHFNFDFQGLIPKTLYTVMALRKKDLDPDQPTRPGPLGMPNVFVTDRDGTGRFHACLPDPFPDPASQDANRIVNVVVLWMSYQMSYGGAIGRFGFGGDIHAQLKLKEPSFSEFITRA
ncbi:MAG: hypothetical protein Q4G49_04280 [Paracoccus sp. (in: a-proteobacteria)]|nr:hypothetical protein [Paracoccus sp. (in: a-proteobacteria)]